MQGSDSSGGAGMLYDSSDWPIFRVIVPKSGLTLDELQAHFDRVGALHESREPFAILVDALHARPLDASARQLVAENLRFNARRFPGVMRGLAVCLRGTVARGGFTAINWLARPPYPTAAFESISAASVWLSRQLKAPTSPHTRASV
ncbi:MAG TPA: hypothetical protein VF103_06460 [Polyangiaceae bacterium]